MKEESVMKWVVRAFFAITIPVVALALVILVSQVGYAIGVWDLPPRVLEGNC